MLERLSVENYALIERLDLELSSGLNIITGETGAGKSILLGALGLILGNRADTGVLKDESRNCVIEGVFVLKGYGLEGFFTENELDYEDTTVIRRVISPAGKSRAYVNDIPVQLTMLRDLSMRLIDIHSQNQSVLAADEGFRLRVVDALARNSETVKAYSEVYANLKGKERELSRMKADIEQSRRDEAYMRFQWEQLAALGLKPGELQELEAEQSELANAGEILSGLGAAEELLGNDDGGILTRLKSAVQNLQHIEKVFCSAGELSQRIQSAYVELKDIDSEIALLAGRIESNPARLEVVDSKLGAIYSLMKKNGVESADDLIVLEKDLRQKLDAITGAGENIAEIEKDIEILHTKAVDAAVKVTISRKKAADTLSKGVEKILGRLGMPGARFVAEVSPAAELSSSGADEIYFMFDANREGRLQPLEKVASGGETSRVMLALKSVVARSAMLPTIIFDEIDTGVSGRIADVTGDIIAELGDAMQVINITHLPQVASKGNTHFLVYKEETPTGTRTSIRLLEREQRVEEIAKMLSGTKITPAAVSQARSLLGYE